MRSISLTVSFVNTLIHNRQTLLQQRGASKVTQTLIEYAFDDNFSKQTFKRELHVRSKRDEDRKPVESRSRMPQHYGRRKQFGWKIKPQDMLHFCLQVSTGFLMERRGWVMKLKVNDMKCFE